MVGRPASRGRPALVGGGPLVAQVSAAAQQLGKLQSYAATAVDGGGYVDFTLVFQIPQGTTPCSLLFTLLRYPDDVGGEGEDVKVTLGK